jgi:hypothetical protein
VQYLQQTLKEKNAQIELLQNILDTQIKTFNLILKQQEK